ncbi:PTS fructose transporter subunit IIC [Clostridium sp. ZS2-4]|uniref:PTS fructose transporter subunit IIC n=1 Tax=Clostridium sp. ZS2-4 TaxID=2987703 RepID=UPI00227B04DD|nr:PTS fructose transporter subunit IIC [Clostridium sp. ZS2-4]MCY6354439.1 PTS fructose transporter subunit IIC [Clostridium sp. ZS2-4]
MSKETVKEKWAVLQSHLMTGISYMVPVIVASGTIMGISVLVGQGMGFNAGDPKLLESTNELISFFAWAKQVAGKNLMGLMFPIFSAFVAYSIADRPGLGPGFLGGLLAQLMGSGFLGAMLIGFLAGYVADFLNKKVKVKRTYIGIKTMFIIPVVGALAVIILSRYLVGPIGIAFTKAITSLINGVGDTGGTVLSGIFGGAMGFDLGGPINKTANTLSKQLTIDTNFTQTPVILGAIIPPIGLGLATIIDKYIVGKSVFPPELKASGTPCFLLGFLGISEGAIPFALSDPLGTIPINVMGSAIGAAMSYTFGCWAYIGVPWGFYGWPLIKNIVGFLISLAVGVAFVAVASVFRRNYIYKKQLAEAEAEAAAEV